MLNMFKTVAELTQTVNAQREEINKLKQDLASTDTLLETVRGQAAQWKEAANVLKEQWRDAEHAVSFKAMNAFAIERNHGSEGPCTIIGYFGPDSTVNEWTLFCNEEVHAKLVEQFKSEMKGE